MMIELDIRNISHTRHKNLTVRVGGGVADAIIDLGFIDNTECIELARKLSGYIDDLLHDLTTEEVR